MKQINIFISYILLSYVISADLARASFLFFVCTLKLLNLKLILVVNIIMILRFLNLAKIKLPAH